FKRLAVGCEYELGLLFNRLRALPECVESRRNFTFSAHPNVNVVALKNSARKVRLIRGSTLKPFYRSFLIPERLQKRERKARGIERLLSELRNGFFDFNGIHTKQ